MAITIYPKHSHSRRDALKIREQDIVDFSCVIRMKQTYGDSFTFDSKDYTVEISGNTLHHIFLHSLESSAKFRGAVLTYITNLNNAQEATE